MWVGPRQGFAYDAAAMRRPIRSRRPRVRWRARFILAAGASAALAVLLGACGSQGVQVSEGEADHAGAVLFAEHCSGCHSLKAAGTEGSANGDDPTSGPNFNNRKENVQSVLYAIRNGGFSGAIMPANVVVGEQADQVARFVAHYAGKNAKAPPAPPPVPQANTNTSTTPTATTPATTTPAGPSQAQLAEGEKLFKQKCGTCHTLAAAGTKGTIGPNLDDLRPSMQVVLQAIALGPGVMPAKLYTGKQAQAVAAFVAAMAGKQ